MSDQMENLNKLWKNLLTECLIGDDYGKKRQQIFQSMFKTSKLIRTSLELPGLSLSKVFFFHVKRVCNVTFDSDSLDLMMWTYFTPTRKKFYEIWKHLRLHRERDKEKSGGWDVERGVSNIFHFNCFNKLHVYLQSFMCCFNTQLWCNKFSKTGSIRNVHLNRIFQKRFSRKWSNLLSEEMSKALQSGTTVCAQKCLWSVYFLLLYFELFYKVQRFSLRCWRKEAPFSK